MQLQHKLKPGLHHLAPTAVKLETLYLAKIIEAEAINRAQKQALTWEVIQRTALPELWQEDVQLVFLDTAKKKPNWFIAEKNLKQLGEQLGYTHQNYIQFLHHFIGYYDPTLIPVAQQLSAEELDQYLMYLTVPEPLKEYMSEEMSCLIRHPAGNLHHTMAQLKALVTCYYPEYFRKNLRS